MGMEKLEAEKDAGGKSRKPAAARATAGFLKAA